MEPRLFTSCSNCGCALRTIHVELTGTVWTHLDGHRECSPTYASPNFDRQVSADGTYAKTVSHS